MMSRITLHLRKQARSREDDARLQTFSMGTVSALRSRLRFVRSGADSAAAGPDGRVAVTVQESTVTHDDAGRLMDKGAVDEWYELHQPAPVRLPTSGRKGDGNPELRYVV